MIAAIPRLWWRSRRASIAGSVEPLILWRFGYNHIGLWKGLHSLAQLPFHSR